MAQKTWSPPDVNTDAFTGVVTNINNMLENLRTNHSGTGDPSAGDGSTAYMFRVNTNAATDVLEGRDAADSAWIVLGDWVDNLGHLRLDGANAMTAALDLNGQQIKDLQNSVNTNTPSGATALQLEVDVAGTTYFVPAYAAASAWSV